MRKILSIAMALVLLAGTGLIFHLMQVPASHAVQPVFGETCSGIAVTTNDGLDFQGTSIATNAAALVTYRMKRSSDGVLFTDQFATNSGGANGGGIRFPYAGCLIFASVFVSDSGEQIGGANFYGQLMLFAGTRPQGGRGGGGSIIPPSQQSKLLAVLVGGCMNSIFIYTWPTSGVANPESCQGLPQSLSVSNPAAGANWQTTLNIGLRHRILNIRYTLTTSASAGNRFAGVNFLTGGVSGTVVGSRISPYAQQPTQTVVYNFAAGTGDQPPCTFLGGTQTAVLCPEVDIALPSYWETVAAFETSRATSFAINSAVNGLLAGDTITGITIRELAWNSTD